jgi:hypothetical protein
MRCGLLFFEDGPDRGIRNSGETALMERSAFDQRWSVWVLALCFCGMLFPTLHGAEENVAVVPAWQRFRAEHLSAEQAGRLLISELNCQSCHGAYAGLSVQPRQAPVLTAAAQRLNPAYVRQFLEISSSQARYGYAGMCRQRHPVPRSLMH